ATGRSRASPIPTATRGWSRRSRRGSGPLPGRMNAAETGYQFTDGIFRAGLNYQSHCSDCGLGKSSRRFAAVAPSASRAERDVCFWHKADMTAVLGDVFDRDQSEPIPLVITFIWVRACNDGVRKCAITAFRASNRGLPKLPTSLPCATLGPAHEDSRHRKIRAWQSACYQERS